MTSGRRTIYIVTEGEYSNYRVLCAYESEADAHNAVAAGVGDDYAELPLLPAGHIPRKVTLHQATVRRDGVITGRYAKDDWEFNAPAGVHEWSTINDFYITGRDEARVDEAAQDRAARLRAEQEELTSP